MPKNPKLTPPTQKVADLVTSWVKSDRPTYKECYRFEHFLDGTWHPASTLFEDMAEAPRIWEHFKDSRCGPWRIQKIRSDWTFETMEWPPKA